MERSPTINQKPNSEAIFLVFNLDFFFVFVNMPCGGSAGWIHFCSAFLSSNNFHGNIHLRMQMASTRFFHGAGNILNSRTQSKQDMELKLILGTVIALNCILIFLIRFGGHNNAKRYSILLSSTYSLMQGMQLAYAVRVYNRANASPLEYCIFIFSLCFRRPAICILVPTVAGTLHISAS